MLRSATYWQLLSTVCNRKLFALQGAKDATVELHHVQEELAAQQAEFNDLLACLGQETAKVAALQSLLGEKYQEDVSELLEKVEEEYGFGVDDTEDTTLALES
jgi:hypothetical protein